MSIVRSNSSGRYECGLEHQVILKGCSLGARPGQLPACQIEAINKKVALAIIKRPGPLSGKEARFLRNILSVTVARFAMELSITIEDLDTFESSIEGHLSMHLDRELRRRIFQHFERKPAQYRTLANLYYAERSREPITITVDAEILEPLALAA